MNVDQDPSAKIGAATWERQAMRRALAARDLKTVYELLQRTGVSQRAIARLTGQSASEVYEVLYKGRRIMAYDVLVRIADGLGIPRGYLGLSYDRTTEVALDLAIASCSNDASERDEVRALLSDAANVTMGTSVNEIARWWQPVDRDTAPAPSQIGRADVENIHALTAAMKIVDARYGGGACRDAVAAQVRWAQQLVTARCDDEALSLLLLALADLHLLAGWTSFDVGMYTVARRHFLRALEQARWTGDYVLVAKVLYCMGKLHLHRGMYMEALRFFQLGQIAGQDSGSALTVSMLCANEGAAYALLGDRGQMHRSLLRAQDEYARADPVSDSDWVRFFGEADLYASLGVAQVSLVGASSAELDDAVANTARAIALRGSDMTRSRTFELTALATAYVRSGVRELGLQTGNDAVSSATTVRSIRTLDRLTPLRTAAHEREGDAEFADLVHRIDSVRASA
ncbi:helix-turn-helix transcriptional regulator [Nocardia terpenica]|uniref:helix-turn-helix domain-containing protein n=1 Tax=Nocardia terpenica TaxID=455432 RepID=UPI002FE216F5